MYIYIYTPLCVCVCITVDKFLVFLLSNNSLISYNSNLKHIFQNSLRPSQAPFKIVPVWSEYN